MTVSVARIAGFFISALTIAGAAFSTPASARDCETWKGDWEIRCLSTNADLVDTLDQTVFIQNVSSRPISFRYQQWDSTCGWPGSSTGNPAVATLQPSGRIEVVLQSAPFGGGIGGARCTEIFFFSCMSGNTSIRCMGSLGASMGPPRPGIFGIGKPFGTLGQ
jgi:hypothetical protein